MLVKHKLKIMLKQKEYAPVRIEKNAASTCFNRMQFLGISAIIFPSTS